MSTLDRTEQRISRAVDRLEAAFRARSDQSSWGNERERLAARVEMLGQESGRLREERAELQRALDVMRRRYEALLVVAASTEDRLQAAIADLDDLLGT